MSQELRERFNWTLRNMTWFPSFFRPSMAWLFALLIPVIVFYFLKLRRSRLEVSSLVLWRQVINDQRVNAPFQKFKRNILLLLQLFLVALLALAAMQPYVRGEAAHHQYLPILIDCSASMAAVDREGVSRLDLAKKEVAEIIESLAPGQQLTLISVGATSRRLTEFTDNKPVLRAALKNIQVQDVPSRIEDGLRLAQALARSQDIQSVRFYSDGNLKTKPNPATGQPMAAVDFDLPFPVDFFQIAPVGGNIGVTEMNARRSATEHWDVFLRIDGSVTESAEADVVLTANGETIGTEHVILGPGESQRLVFRVDAQVANRLQAELRPVGHDALLADNVAWLNLPPGREIKVYCDPEQSVFRHALEVLPGVAVDSADDDEGSSSPYDLVVSDKLTDEQRDGLMGVFLGVVPRDLQPLIDVTEETAEVVDWQREAQLLQHVQLKDVVISELPVKKADVEDVAIEELGYDILAYGNRGPLIVRKRDGNKLSYYFLFDINQSTLPYRVGFPVLVSNIVTEAMQQASLDELRAPATGVLPPLTLSPGETCRVTLPGGQQDERTTNADGVLTGVAATAVGQYEIYAGGKLIESIGVGLLSPAETSLLTVDKIQFNESSVEAADERLKRDRPLWGTLAFVAFAVLLFEWWYFQKKPSGLPD